MTALVIAACVLVLMIYAVAPGRADETVSAPFLRRNFAHRGLYAPDQSVPENSLAAFRLAVENGYGVELDVHLMKDGNLAVVHDSHLGRMCGADALIEDLTAEDLPMLKLDYSDETVPLFEDALKLFEDRPEPIIVELKTADGNYKALSERTMELLDRYNVQFCVESFDPRAVSWFRKNRPDVIRGQLSANLSGPDAKKSGNKPFLLWSVQHLFCNLLSCPDFIAYDFSVRGLPELWLCRRLYHVQEVSWTIRSEADLEKAEALGNLVIFEGFGY